MDVHLPENGRKAIGVVLLPLRLSISEPQPVGAELSGFLDQTGKKASVVKPLKRSEHAATAAVNHLHVLSLRSEDTYGCPVFSSMGTENCKGIPMSTSNEYIYGGSIRTPVGN
jgi:hypothetical protein